MVRYFLASRKTDVAARLQQMLLVKGTHAPEGHGGHEASQLKPEPNDEEDLASARTGVVPWNLAVEYRTGPRVRRPPFAIDAAHPLLQQ
ncbi:MAG: hypothetical protein U1F25_04295 [Rubrivivax sp.]